MKYKKIIIIAAIIIAFFAILFATGVLKLRISVTPVKTADTESSAPNPSPKSDEYAMAEYKSERYGYSIKYPLIWRMDDSQEETPGDLILSPSKDVAVVVQLINDPSLSIEGGFDLVSNEAKKQFADNPRYEIDLFKLVPEQGSPPYVIGGFVAAGTFLGEKTNQAWRFKEYGIFTKTGKAFYVRGNIKKEVAGEYGEVVNQIMDSFDIE